MIRSQRKAEHILLATRLADGPSSAGFEDVHLVNQSLPGFGLEDVDLSTHLASKPLNYPLVINALTGGTDQSRGINRSLASLAGRYGLAMAVGSQTAAIHDPGLRPTFTVVREENPDGVILANVSAALPVQHALEAVDMIQADALQIHFNVPQELAMREGDRDFSEVLANVVRLVERCPVPVIAKEVGFGFSRETAQTLYQAGVRCFDIGGKGGTNFTAIEDERNGLFGHEFDDWGIPTAVSLAELHAWGPDLLLTASGGLRSALDGIKAIAMGAKLIGMAGPVLRILMEQGAPGLENYLQSYLYRLQAGFLMTGSRTLQELQKKPVVIMGNTGEWLKIRGIDPQLWARNV